MGRKLSRAVISFLDPRTYFQIVRLLHFYHYTHIEPRSKATLGHDARLAPNVSLRNGERISIGARSRIGEHAFLWAGDSSGHITIGADCRFGPGVFVTASDYGLMPDELIATQEKNEQDIVIGNDVWLGANVFVAAGVNIGDGCVVGAGSAVTRSLPAGSIAVGVPARVVRRREDYAPAAGDKAEATAEAEAATT
ncbi:MAG: acyltransferase [Gaiellales bacterium]